jgi:hypothetical protein
MLTAIILQYCHLLFIDLLYIKKRFKLVIF